MIFERSGKGFLTIDNPKIKGGIYDLRINVGVDGRIWICADGESFIRFKPLTPDVAEFMERDRTLRRRKKDE